MRTTITLDDDVAAELQARRRAEDRTFKDVVNEVLRAGLRPRLPEPTEPVQYTHPTDLGAAVDVADVSAVLGMLDEEKYGHLA